MPCMCDGYTPERIYRKKFIEESLKLLNEKKIEEIKRNYDLEENSRYEDVRILCKICKHLTKWQMKNIRPCIDIENLFDFYVDHVIHDVKGNIGKEREIARNELDRLGVIFTINERGSIIYHNSHDIKITIM